MHPHTNHKTSSTCDMLLTAAIFKPQNLCFFFLCHCKPTSGLPSPRYYPIFLSRHGGCKQASCIFFFELGTRTVVHNPTPHSAQADVMDIFGASMHARNISARSAQAQQFIGTCSFLKGPSPTIPAHGTSAMDI